MMHAQYVTSSCYSSSLIPRPSHVFQHFTRNVGKHGKAWVRGYYSSGIIIILYRQMQVYAYVHTCAQLIKSLLTSPRVILPKMLLAQRAPAVPTIPTIMIKRPRMINIVLSCATLELLFVISKYVLSLTCMNQNAQQSMHNIIQIESVTYFDIYSNDHSSKSKHLCKLQLIRQSISVHTITRMPIKSGIVVHFS